MCTTQAILQFISDNLGNHKTVKSYSIYLYLSCFSCAGIKLRGGIGSKWQGIYVQEVVPNSPASEEGSIQPKDRIIYINGRCTLGMTLEDAVKTCEHASRKVRLKAMRYWRSLLALYISRDL